MPLVFANLLGAQQAEPESETLMLRTCARISIAITFLLPALALAEEAMDSPATCTSAVAPWLCAVGIVTQIGWPFAMLIVVGIVVARRGARNLVGSLVRACAGF